MPFELVSSAGTQSPFITQIYSRKSAGVEGPDVVQVFSQVGKDVKKIFASRNRTEKPTENTASENSQSGVSFSSLMAGTTDHELSFGMVYANDLAKTEIEKENPQFPVGSIIVREKNETATSEPPQTVIAMVKREKGFSEATGDWEFFVFDGADLKLNSRESVGNCATCHIQAEKTDWVFRDYLK